MNASLLNPDEVRKAINLLIEPGAVFEIRALGATTKTWCKKRTLTGYFNNPDYAIRALSTIATATGIYITLNPVNPDLLARCANRIDDAERGKATGDQHIIRRCRLIVDADPKRPKGLSGSSATDDEMQKAFDKVDEVERFLTLQGFPPPFKAESGNGGHLGYYIDLPANDNRLVEIFLKALSQKFTDEMVKIDETMFNPARICKLYGTLACKGDDTPERPHRFSQITSVPDPLEVVPRELLEKIASLYCPPQKPSTKTASTVNGRASNGISFVRDFLKRYSVGIKDEHVKEDGTTVIELDTCPFNPDHGDRGEAAVFVQADGKLGFNCPHHSCAGNHWQEFRQHYEPTYNPSGLPNDQFNDKRPMGGIPIELPAVRSLADFSLGVDNGGNLLGNRFLCRGGGLLLAAPTGIGKSSWGLQAAVSWSLGLPHLGIKPTGKLKSLIIQAENDDGDISEQRGGVFRGLDLNAEQIEEAGLSVKLVCESTKTGTTFIEMLARLVEQHRPELVWIDPLFAYLGDSVTEQKAVSAFLRTGLNPILQKYGCGAVLIHHTNKPQQGKEKADWKAGDFAYMGSGSGELANWARAVIGIRSLGEHDVFEMVFGKRAMKACSLDGAQNPVYSVFIRHSKTGICWEIGEAPLGKRKSTKQDVFDLIPITGDISQSKLFNDASDVGIGQKKLRSLLQELIEDDRTVHIWMKKRSGTNPAKSYSRHPQGDFGAETLAGEIQLPISIAEVVGRGSERETFAVSLPIGAKKSLSIPVDEPGDFGNDFVSSTTTTTTQTKGDDEYTEL